MNSYGTDDGFLEWLTSQGLPAPTGVPAVLRQIGSNYIDAAYEARLNCSSRSGGFNQPLAWPRTGHRMNGQAVPSDLIPQAWINASYRAAYLEDVTPGWATKGTDASRQTKREKVDTIEREFFSASDAVGTDAAAGMPSDSIINGMVLPWLCKQGVRDPGSLFRII